MGAAKVVNIIDRRVRAGLERRDSALSPDECAIIAGLQNRANLSVKEQSAVLNIPKHRLRRAFDSIEAKGILVGRSPLISPFRLNSLAGNLYLCTPALRQAKRTAMVDALNKLPSGMYASHVEGDFDFMITYVSNNYEQVYTLLAAIGNELGTDFERKMITMTTRFDEFGRKHLATNSIQPGVLHFSMSDTRVLVDEIDVRILRALSEFEFHSHRKIAELLDIHHTLVERRVSKLRANGVLLGMFYRFNLEPAGYQLYRLLITMPGFNLGVRDKFRALAARHPNVVRCVETIGPWDFELVVELRKEQGIDEMEQSIYAAFHGEVTKIQSLRVRQHLFYRGLPYCIEPTQP